MLFAPSHAVFERFRKLFGGVTLENLKEKFKGTGQTVKQTVKRMWDFMSRYNFLSMATSLGKKLEWCQSHVNANTYHFIGPWPQTTAARTAMVIVGAVIVSVSSPATVFFGRTKMLAEAITAFKNAVSQLTMVGYYGAKISWNLVSGGDEVVNAWVPYIEDILSPTVSFILKMGGGLTWWIIKLIFGADVADFMGSTGKVTGAFWRFIVVLVQNSFRIGLITPIVLALGELGSVTDIPGFFIFLMKGFLEMPKNLLCSLTRNIEWYLRVKDRGFEGLPWERPD